MAARRGAPTFEGAPCINGHGHTRYLHGGNCVECQREASRRRWAARDEKWKRQRREQYATEHGRADRRNRNLIRNYGMTQDQFDAMLKAQDGRCAICNIESSQRKRVFAVDHCHRTGKVRALLCDTCNLGIGAFGEDRERMQKAIQYLRRHNG